VENAKRQRPHNCNPLMSMMTRQSFFTPRLIVLALLPAILSCGAQAADKSDKAQPQKAENVVKQPIKVPTAASDNASRLAATNCDASLWNHVYDPTRLQKISDCIAATGTIEESSADEDGDQHFLLKLDPGQEGLLKKRNMKKKSGALVVEIVCANPVHIKKARAACAGYTNPITIPAVGAHVKVSGSYVIDTHNKWTEIHPVSQIEVIK
jgi:hypothetical protein